MASFSTSNRSSRSASYDQNRPVFPAPNEQDLIKILIEGDANLLVHWAHEMGRHLAKEDKLTTSQLRTIFGTVRQIQMRWQLNKPEENRAVWSEIVLLRPKMAYQAKRALKSRDHSIGLENLRKVIEGAIILLGRNNPPTDAQFKRFVDFFEAIVAYHTQYDPKG